MSDILSVGMTSMQNIPQGSENFEPASVSSEDKAQFESLLEGNADSAAEVNPTGSTVSVGDKIIEGFSELKSSRDSRLKTIEEMGELDLSPAEMTKMHLDVVQLTAQGELIAKVATNGSKLFNETLLKMN